MSLLEQRSVSFALVVLVDRGVLSILSLCSCDPTFKQQAVMPISAKSVDEVRSRLIDNGFAADTFEYASMVAYLCHSKISKKRLEIFKKYISKKN